MKRLRMLYSSLHPFARFSCRLGLYIMFCYYIVALFARNIAPGSVNYFGVLAVYHGALEAAPASLAAGVCAGLLCDIIYRSQTPGPNDKDKWDSM